MLRGMWDLPGPGLEPVSPALAGGFLTTAPPGKSPAIISSNIFFFPILSHISFRLSNKVNVRLSGNIPQLLDVLVFFGVFVFFFGFVLFFLLLYFFPCVSVWVICINPSDLTHFLLEPLAYLITVTLNFLSDSSNICDMPESDSNDSFVSWDFFLAFSYA